MAFELYNFSEVSTSLNQGVITAAIATPSSDTSTLQGSMNVFTYFSSSDTFATIAASNYFLPVVIDMLVYDVIIVTGSDISGILQVATSVPPTDISSGSITTQTFLNGSLGDFTTITSLTNAQLLALYTTPILLVPSQGTGTLIQLKKYEIDYTFATAATASGGEINAQYGSTTHQGGIVCSQGIPAATLNGLTANGQLMDYPAPWGAVNTACENVGLYLSAATGVFTTGAGTAKVYTTYSVITPA